MNSLNDFELAKLLGRIKESRHHRLWQGEMKQGKYPTFSFKDGAEVRQLNVARFLYERANGPIGRATIGRTCKEFRCVAPACHQLRQATLNARGRSRRIKEMRKQRAELVRKLAADNYLQKEIADSLGLSYSMVSRVINHTRG
jgi:hypothetical protein